MKQSCPSVRYWADVCMVTLKKFGARDLERLRDEYVSMC
jgi:hypothetical protein